MSAPRRFPSESTSCSTATARAPQSRSQSAKCASPPAGYSLSAATNLRSPLPPPASRSPYLPPVAQAILPVLFRPLTQVTSSPVDEPKPFRLKLPASVCLGLERPNRPPLSSTTRRGDLSFSTRQTSNVPTLSCNPTPTSCALFS